MKNHRRVRFLMLSLLGALALHWMFVGPAHAERPDIVLILADDKY